MVLERQGVPVAVICTEPFVATAEAMLRLKGVPDYPYATVPHPIGSLTPAEVQERARAALPQVLRILLAKP